MICLWFAESAAPTAATTATTATREPRVESSGYEVKGT